jgi:hypothetical protein
MTTCDAARYHERRTRWPAFYNAIKYCFICSVILLGLFNPSYSRSLVGRHIDPYQALWIVCSVISTAYTSWWDAYQGWGLLRRSVDDERHHARRTAGGHGATVNTTGIQVTIRPCHTHPRFNVTTTRPQDFGPTTRSIVTLHASASHPVPTVCAAGTCRRGRSCAARCCSAPGGRGCTMLSWCKTVRSAHSGSSACSPRPRHPPGPTFSSG